MNNIHYGYALPIVEPSWWELDNSSMVEFALEQETPYEFKPLDRIVPNEYHIKIRAYSLKMLMGKEVRIYTDWAWRKLMPDSNGVVSKHIVDTDGTHYIRIFTDRPPTYGIWNKVLDNTDSSD